MKFEDATDDLNARLSDPEAKKSRAPRPVQEASNMAMLQSLMKQTDFRGATG